MHLYRDKYMGITQEKFVSFWFSDLKLDLSMQQFSSNFTFLTAEYMTKKNPQRLWTFGSTYNTSLRIHANFVHCLQ